LASQARKAFCVSAPPQVIMRPDSFAKIGALEMMMTRRNQRCRYDSSLARSQGVIAGALVTISSSRK